MGRPRLLGPLFLSSDRFWSPARRVYGAAAPPAPPARDFVPWSPDLTRVTRCRIYTPFYLRQHGPFQLSVFRFCARRAQKRNTKGLGGSLPRVPFGWRGARGQSTLACARAPHTVSVARSATR